VGIFDFFQMEMKKTINGRRVGRAIVKGRLSFKGTIVG
jgi:hypothetical protein